MQVLWRKSIVKGIFLRFVAKNRLLSYTEIGLLIKRIKSVKF